jgi:AcrR family transcriptional regulator
VVDAASRLFREKGVANVSVVDVMRSVGLTQGGFYKQFESKAALADESAARAFAAMLESLAAMDEDCGGHGPAWTALVDSYLSPEARDNPGAGCPAAGFAGDASRDAGLRDTYVEGVLPWPGGSLPARPVWRRCPLWWERSCSLGPPPGHRSPSRSCARGGKQRPASPVDRSSRGGGPRSHRLSSRG